MTKPRLIHEMDEHGGIDSSVEIDGVVYPEGIDPWVDALIEELEVEAEKEAEEEAMRRSREAGRRAGPTAQA
jgi:hypothetical protein